MFFRASTEIEILAIILCLVLMISVWEQRENRGNDQRREKKDNLVPRRGWVILFSAEKSPGNEVKKKNKKKDKESDRINREKNLKKLVFTSSNHFQLRCQTSLEKRHLMHTTGFGLYTKPRRSSGPGRWKRTRRVGPSSWPKKAS